MIVAVPVELALQSLVWSVVGFHPHLDNVHAWTGDSSQVGRDHLEGLAAQGSSSWDVVGWIR